VALALAFLLGVAAPVRAAMGDAHALVVRGNVRASNGSPIVGAIITSRGSYSVSATTDEHGHYTLNVPLSSAAGLRGGPFALEVRAEIRGRKLPLANGQPAMSFELTLLSSGTTVRVRSNLRDATSSLASAFSQASGTTAWIDADFGGVARASGTVQMSAVEDVDASGRTPRGESPAPGANAAPATPPAATPPKSAPPSRPAAAPANRDTARATAPAPASTAAKPPVPTGVVRALPMPKHVASGASDQESRSDEERSSLTSPRPKSSRSRHDRGRPSAPPAADPVGDSQLHLPSVGPMHMPAAPPEADRVKAIDGSPQPTVPFDSCACRLWGTVEVDWDRPLERNFPIGLTFTGPATQRAEVEMFMGSPREFRFGPLPCGDYRLTVHPMGKLRYAVARGDSVLAVHCTGTMQVRIVLVPRTGR
jgi:hypothetical protein